MTTEERVKLREEYDAIDWGQTLDSYTDDKLFHWFVTMLEERAVLVGLQNFQIHMEEVNKLREQIKKLKSTKLNKEGKNE